MSGINPRVPTAAKVAAPNTGKLKKQSDDKWGKAVMDLGFCIVPSLLLKAQRRLNLTPTQLAVLLQLCDHWWDANRKPFPSKETLSERLTLSARQVQRHIAEMEKMGLVRREERIGKHNARVSNRYDLDGLVKRLQEIEPDFRKAEEVAKQTRKDAAKPGLRRRASAPEEETEE
jgi:hypothetical protein